MTQTPQNPLDLHCLKGTIHDLQAALTDLLRAINHHWHRRLALIISSAVLSFALSVFLVFFALYLPSLAALFLTATVLVLGFSGGRFLEIEVETVTLALALCEKIAPSIDAQAQCHARVDMRSSVHASKQVDLEFNGSVHDEWFLIEAPLENGRALRLQLTELVHAKQEREELGKRVGRDYHVALYAAHGCKDSDLIEAVTSHVAAPSGTNIPTRVREGIDAFQAGVDQLISGYGGHEQYKIIEVKEESRGEGQLNPRLRPTRKTSTFNAL